MIFGHFVGFCFLGLALIFNVFEGIIGLIWTKSRTCNGESGLGGFGFLNCLEERAV